MPFPATASTLWNTLPDYMKSALTVMTFRRHLKPHLFNLAYHM